MTFPVHHKFCGFILARKLMRVCAKKISVTPWPVGSIAAKGMYVGDFSAHYQSDIFQLCT